VKKKLYLNLANHRNWKIFVVRYSYWNWYCISICIWLKK